MRLQCSNTGNYFLFNKIIRNLDLVRNEIYVKYPEYIILDEMILIKLHKMHMNYYYKK